MYPFSPTTSRGSNDLQNSQPVPKYIGLLFAIAFSTVLLENQSSTLAGIMKRTTSQILDVIDADIWVMDKKTMGSVELTQNRHR